ncbi:Uu.00g029430.m01.CDS01 [Anthostomella pinea]|uniref:Uu.00g029430.m01.CDS01 n=1 Tax=Anthostomella pinea TaxID=933095 RepID=A0AAI8V849_9PEZI|nr:Uu.00g029430.m01.CDS01 [Anthostomella pinea]
MRTWLYIAGALLALYVRHWVKTSRTRRVHDALIKQHGCRPPPLLQNQRPFGVDRLEQIFRADAESRLMELFLFHFRQTGYTLKQCFLGTPAYGTVDPANLEAMLNSRFNDFSNGPRRAITFPMFGDGIFTQDGEAWRHSRKMLQPQLVHRQYEDLSVFRQPMDDLLEVLPTGGGVVDLQPLFFRYTLDVTTAFLFGESIRSLKASEDATKVTFASAFDTAQKWVTKRFRLLDLYWLIGGREFYQACNHIHRFADEIIEQNLQKEKATDESDMRYVFLKHVDEQSDDRAALRGQIINILTAGRDTTACALSWTLYGLLAPFVSLDVEEANWTRSFHLVRHPSVMAKLQAEIAELPSGVDGPITRTDLKNLKYLQNVMKEILRLYPSVPVNTRTSTTDTVLPTGGGPDRKSPVFIPKGSAVAYSVYTMHRRPDLYGMDAEVFRPERWEEEMPLDKDPITQRWGYLPFSGGPRLCLGMDFAQTQAAYTIVRILQRYPTIKLPAGETVELTGVEKQTMTLVLQIGEGCKVELQ